MADLIGKKFNKLLVKEYSHNNNRNEKLWKCLCDCGKIAIVKSTNLIRGTTKSCGCIHKGNPRDDSIIGKTFNRILVLSFSHRSSYRDQYYNCLCHCGKSFKLKRDKIGINKSCGCCMHTSRAKGFEKITGTYWGTTRNGAKYRGLEFSITIEYAWEIFVKQESRCALTGVEITLDKSYKNHKRVYDSTASIDRIDSKLGYIIGNIQWVHKDINRLKGNMDEEILYNWCKRITETIGIKYEKH